MTKGYITNGPSLTGKDLDMINEMPSFSSIRMNLILDKTKWKPYYYTMSDSSMANNFFDEVNLMEKQGMFAVVTNFGYDTLKKYFKTQHLFLRSSRKKIRMDNLNILVILLNLRTYYPDFFSKWLE